MGDVDGVIFDFGLTLAYPPTFADAVNQAGQDLGRSEQHIAAFIDALYGVDEHPAVVAAEARRDYSPAEHRAADMAYVEACDGDRELMEAFYELVVSPG